MERVEEMIIGRLGRHCYALFCFGVLIISVCIYNCVCADEESNDNHVRTKRRLRALHHGHPLPPSHIISTS